MYAGALTLELHLPESHSLKAKRAIIKPVIEGCRRRFQVAAAEVDHQDAWQRAALGFSAVSGRAGQVTEVLDKVERFVWSFPELEVVSASRSWLDREEG
jgi:uncharacterized protein YlxP (DUF503 family)